MPDADFRFRFYERRRVDEERTNLPTNAHAAYLPCVGINAVRVIAHRAFAARRRMRIMAFARHGFLWYRRRIIISPLTPATFVTILSSI